MKRYIIDLPNPYNLDDVRVNYVYYDTWEEALAVAKEQFGADDEGRISIISSFEEEDDV